MFYFYLRQTVPFVLTDLPHLLQQFFTKKDNIDQLVTQELSKTTKSNYIVLTHSMRAALLKSLEFFKIKQPKKNEILIPEYSFHSNLSCCIKAGFKVKFVPVNQKTLFIDEKKLEKLITQKTLGIIITHLHGKVYDLEKIRKIINKHKLIIFEDCAHAFPLSKLFSKNEKYLNHAGSIKFLSFGPGKFITTFGGGALATNNKELFQFVDAHTVETKGFKTNLVTFNQVCLYTAISNPSLAYFTMKPVLGLFRLFKKQRNKHDVFDPSQSKAKMLPDMNTFQKKLLLMQLTIFNTKIKQIIKRRQQIAAAWYQQFKNQAIDEEFCFQLPILVNDRNKYIQTMWHQNIDVQKDYCSYLPSLIDDQKSFSLKKANFYKKIVYLPTNQYLSSQVVKSIKM